MSRTIVSATLVVLLSAFATANAGEHGFNKDRDHGFKGWQHQSPVSAPEIGIASAGAALALLAGGIFILRGRRTVKKD